MTVDTATNETVELMQVMIRNACVNDGRAESGQEVRSSDTLQAYLEGSGLDLEVYEPTPGRRSLITRITGSDPAAPTLCLMGHTDVVPVSPDGWSRDPFGGELVGGELWGRGALDMLNLTASMAVATKQLARQGWKPRGTLIYFAVADEEAGGRHGAGWMVANERDAVDCDWVITESGGVSVHGPRGHRVTVTVGEKGTAWRRLRVRGTPGHGSTPYRSDNALVTAAEVVRRLATYRPATHVNEIWNAYVSSLDLPSELIGALSDASTVDDALERLPDARTAKFAHACTHMTLSPNVVHGGVKTNVIPDEVVIEVDIRTLPGQTADDVARTLDDALGPALAARVTIEQMSNRVSSVSPIGTPVYDAMEKVAKRFYPEATLMPRITAGGTDATFFREVGIPSYGFGLYSARVTFEEFSSRFHGNDERIDVESLRLTTQAWLELCRDVLD
jgi:acetylornithine deacetylase/succinyl-diaminopimelate desuccinylase-like protein